VLVAPISRSAMVTGKVLGGTALALLQGVVFLVLAPLAGVPLGLEALAWILPLMGVIGFGLTGLGFVIAWRMESTMGYHAIMSVVLLPMWALSGAVFPQAGTPWWLHTLMAVNPLTYGVAALRRAFYGVMAGPVHGIEMPTFGWSCVAVIGFAVLMFLLGRVVARTRTAADLL
jgi:ABC-2 type transport system permease protein